MMKKILATTIAILVAFAGTITAQDLALLDDGMEISLAEPTHIDGMDISLAEPTINDGLMSVPEAPIIGAVTNTFLSRGLVSFEYNMSFPIGEFNDFISGIGFRGFHFEYKAVLDDNWTIGGSIGWYGFYEKIPRDTYEFEQGALTTTIFRYFYSLPLKVVAQYYFAPSAFVQPFVGLSLGVSYNEVRQEIGFYVVEDRPWTFIMTPEVGVLIPFGSTAQWGAVIKGRYNHNFYKTEFFNSVQTIDATIGLVYSY